MKTAAILKQIKDLPDSLEQELIDFIEFLQEKYGKQASKKVSCLFVGRQITAG